MSKEKLTIDQKLARGKAKQASPILYGVLKYLVARPILAKGYGFKKNFITDFRKEKGPYILISNHASRADYVFNSAWLKPRFTFVLGYNEFFRSHLAPLMNMLHNIPKRNFTADYHTMKLISEHLKKGHSISIYPEGMSSIGGMNQPVTVGTGKFLKHFGVPVYYSVIKGGYLSMPKFNCVDRKGTVEADLDIMFTPDDLKKLTPQEIEDILNEKLFHDDFRWNKEKQYHYDAKGKIAEGLETLLYKCPSCGEEFKMEVTGGDTIRCTKCGNAAKVDDTYMISPVGDSKIPEFISTWYNWQRDELRKEILANPNFKMTEKVKLGNLPDYKYLKDKATSIVVGEGTVTISRNGFEYIGTRNKEPFSFHLSTDEVPTFGMCTDITRFYTFFNGVFMEFYPIGENHVMKFFMAAEELHRANGGKWQDFKFDKNVMQN